MVECIYRVEKDDNRGIPIDLCIRTSLPVRVKGYDCEKCPFRNDFTRKGENN